MAALATPAELATYLQTATEDEWQAGNPDVLDTARAQQLLDNASEAVRDECGWSITQETITGQRLWDPQWRGGYIFLPTKRLTAFSLTVNGVLKVDGTDYTWDRNGSMVRFRGSYWWLSTGSNPIVEITWTHGYTTTPQNPKAVCLEHAAYYYPNPSRHRSETIEGLATVYTAPDLRHDARLDKYRLVGVA